MSSTDLPLSVLEGRIGYRFATPNLLWQALTHPSNAGEASYQRLEFLGDSVLGLLVAEMLYRFYPNEAEGSLAKRHSALVCGPMLAEVANDIGLGAALRLGQSEEMTDGRRNLSNLEDACEALIGAMYLDGGLEAARAFVEAHWKMRARTTLAPPRDAKTTLQEWAQSKSLPLPEYTMTGQSGPAHAPVFTVEVQVGKYPPQQAQGANKRTAEQAAAKAMLAVLKG